MSFGLVLLIAAAGAAGWLMWRSAKGKADAAARNVLMLKIVGALAVAVVLFAAKLWPLAFMTVIAAAAIAAIEVWRDRQIKAEDLLLKDAAGPRASMGADEAASILGVPAEASAEEVRAAHRKLIAQLHPDKGGTDYLASKINDAKDLLLKNRATEGAGGAAPSRETPPAGSDSR
jgi:hypothetical protein